MGANGCGKSTLLKLLSGLLACQGGKINTAKAANAGGSIDYLLYLPQDDCEFSLSPKDFFEMALHKQNKTALSLAKTFGLTEKQIEDTLLSDLSGGERKKVYLSFAFAADPVYLLLDEPTNSLDVYSLDWLYDFIANTNKTLLYISHDESFTALADKVIRL